MANYKLYDYANDDDFNCRRVLTKLVYLPISNKRIDVRKFQLFKDIQAQSYLPIASVDNDKQPSSF